MTRLPLAAALAAASLLALAAPALADPARTGTLASAPADYKWDGGPVSGATADPSQLDATGCVPMQCDDTLVNVGGTGALTITIGNASTGADDLDLYVYKSDATGTQGDPIKSSTGATADESVTFDVTQPGYVLVRVVAATAANGTYSGEAKLDVKDVNGTAAKTDPGIDLGGTPVQPDPGTPPPSTPPPSGDTSGAAVNTAPETVISSPFPGATFKHGHTLTIRGTTFDDGKIAKVRIGLVRTVGKQCTTLKANGHFAKLAKCTAPLMITAKGTAGWHYVAKHLPAGKYVAYALATDAQGLSEGGFGSTNRVRFTVK